MSTVFTQNQRQALAGQAQTITERLKREPSANPVPEADDTFRRWVGTFSDEASFRERLSKDGWTETDARCAVASDKWPRDRQIPDWIGSLETLLEDLQTPPEWIVEEIGPDTQFVQILGAFVDHAWRQLEPSGIDDTSLCPAVSWLADRLQTVVSRPLYVELKSYIEHFDSDLAEADPSQFEQPPAEYHEQFVSVLLDGELASVFLEYPVMGRLLVCILDDWLSLFRRLSTRLREDRPCIEEQFDITGDVELLDPLSVDTHERGQVPVRIVFESGSLVYKPRSVAPRRALNELVGSLETHLPGPTVPGPAVLDRGCYGYMEWVTPWEFDSESEVDEYYRAAGKQLCLAYVLNMNDLQFENVVASRDGPTLVDAETICHTDCGLGGFTDANAARVSIQQSVLRTGLLPVSVVNQVSLEPSPSVPLSGFGDSVDPVAAPGHERVKFRAPNTDAVNVTQTTPEIDKSNATPSRNGTGCPPSSYLSTLVTAFEQCYEKLQELQRDGRLLEETLDLSVLRDTETRCLYRPSATYQSVLKSAYSARGLRDGAEFSVAVESLAAQLHTDGVNTDQYWPLYTAERRALRRGDIPRIVTEPDDPHPEHDGDRLDVEFPETGLERTRRRMEDLSPSDKRRQVELIRQSLGESPTKSPHGTRESDPAPSRACADLAARLFEQVPAASVSSTGGPRWTEIVRGPETLNVRGTGPSLYHGQAGIALTAAALWTTEGDERFRDYATRVISAALDNARSNLSTLPLGIGHGVGSVVYAGTVVSTLLDSQSIAHDVSELVAEFPEDRITDAGSLGLVGGLGGTLLSLIAHHERTGSEAALRKAEQCGRELLSATDAIPESAMATGEGVGFAHGDSGVAYALARLAARTGAQRFETAAIDRFDAVKTCYDNKLKQDEEEWWCRGYPGVTVAFTVGDTLIDGLTVPDWITGNFSGQQPVMSLDHVCCGTAGRVAARLTTGRHTHMEQPSVDDLAADIRSRLRERGRLSLPGHGREVTNPTFFNGVSGVAYTLARLANPETLPSVVSFE